MGLCITGQRLCAVILFKLKYPKIYIFVWFVFNRNIKLLYDYEWYITDWNNIFIIIGHDKIIVGLLSNFYD